MSKAQKIIATHCTWCSCEFDEEEKENPRADCDNNPICDDCYHNEYEFTCCYCEDSGDNDNQHKMAVVFVPTRAAWGDDIPVGIYRVRGGPYWGHNYFSSWLYSDKIEYICTLPDELKDDDPYYSLGHLCSECQVKIEQRAALEREKE